MIDSLPMAPLGRVLQPHELPPAAAPIPGPLAPGEPPGMFDLILRGRRQLSELMTDDAALPGVTRKLLFLSLLGLAVHGAVVGMTASLVDEPLSGLELLRAGHPMLWMPLASMLAFVGALCLCLPSFYFYTQLSGLDASFRLVTAQALRGQATTSVLLLGFIPFYLAAVMLNVLGIWSAARELLLLGLVLPFGVGLFGISAVYAAFGDLAKHLPITHQRRGNFLRRMVLAWGAVYSCVAPVALWRLCGLLSHI